MIERLRAGSARWSAWQPLSGLTLGRLAVVAVLARVVYIARVIPDYVPNADARNYYYLALHVSQGKGVSDTFPLLAMHHTAFRPPAYPLLLGAVFSVTGDSIGVAQALNVLIGTVVVVLAAVLAARLGGRVAGVAAGLVVALYPPIIANDTTVLTEPLSLLFLTLIGLALSGGVWAKGDERTRWRDPAIMCAAVATGLLTLTRPSAQGLAVVLGAWVWWRVGWRRAGVFLAVTLAVVTPWLIRNQIQMGSARLVTTNGFNLASRYSPPAKQDDDFVDAISDPRTAGVHYLIFDEVQLDDAFEKYALKELKKDPLYVLHVSKENAAIWFETDPKKGLPAEKADGRNIDFRTTTRPLFFLVTIAGLLGLVWKRRTAGSQLLLVVAAYFTVTSLPLVAWPRLRAPFDLACCVGAGLAVAWAVERWQRRGDPAPPEEGDDLDPVAPTEPVDRAEPVDDEPVMAEPTLAGPP